MNPNATKDQAVELARMGAGLRILLTDTKRWAVGVRIGMVFAKMGCEVGMLCPAEGHPAHTVGSIRHRFVYDGFRPVASLRAAIERFRPDVVLPTCDRGVTHLHRLYDEAWGEGADWIAETIERSLGPAENFGLLANRYALLKLAAKEGIRIPATMPLRDEGDLESAAGLGPPLVIKADGTWGGNGVKIARTDEEARAAFAELRDRRGLAWLGKELLLNRDRGNTLHDWRNAHPDLIAQAYVDGHPANCAVACWQGKVLAGIAVEVAATQNECGPATVIEVVEGREMLRAAERIARSLHLSGFFGLDFMVETATGAAYLIEMNARSTQPCSLELGKGRNLPVALCAQLAGQPEPCTAAMTDMKRIAYFPKAASAEIDLPLWSYYYDVPEGEPEFVERLLSQWDERSRLGKWMDARRGIDRGGASSPGVQGRAHARQGAARAKKQEAKSLQTGTD